MAAEPTNKEMLRQTLDAVNKLTGVVGSMPQVNIHALSAQISEFMIRQEEINKTVARNHEVLVGNGKEGLKIIVKNLVNEMGAIKRITWIIAGTIITGVTGFLLSLIIGV